VWVPAGGELAHPTLGAASGSSPSPHAAHASTRNTGATVCRAIVTVVTPPGVSVRAALGWWTVVTEIRTLSKVKAARLPFCVRRLAMRIYELLRSKGFDVITVRPTTSVSEALALLKEYNLGAVVVSTDGKQISGILTERDVVRRLCDGPDFLNSPVSDLMTSEVLTCRPGESVQSLMNTMTEQRIRHLPVVDDLGRLAGLVSIGDVVKSHISQIEFERDQLEGYVSHS
jgi:CBS domain-containing protein